MSKRTYTVVHRTFRPEPVETRDLPSGVCGRVTGIALVYGVEDAYGTRFRAGCLDRTKREKVAAGKVSLFADHEYGVRTHIGVVRSMATEGSEERVVADLLDTEDGRRTKEYLEAVVAAGAHTGFSIGFYDRGADGDEFTEVELDELSLTPRNAVPGADVVGVRQDGQAAAWRMFDAALAILPLSDVHARVTALYHSDAATADRSEPGHTPAPVTDAASPDSAPTESSVVPWDARLRAIAAHYRTELHRVEGFQHPLG